jgi:hypothetical protein
LILYGTDQCAAKEFAAMQEERANELMEVVDVVDARAFLGVRKNSQDS